MRNSNPFIFILPGLFLFTLGLGNIGVGTYKADQYNQVVSELDLRAPLSSSLVNASPLRRIKLAEASAHRIFQRRNEAKNRIAFYNLVSFGGKAFMLLGLCFLFISLPTLTKRRSQIQNMSEQVPTK